ncbi:oligoribonuclease [Corynebacterium lipophiloflavum]|uniref:Oligoribonuclease n=1 Tax=Corynebacterium lipophiloflavum (strain ATCC 700352 / DSM 44291 / CCUG 37336 / JCM 10383 / DMMZ 1944) TaxID=525263 RepID=C0XRB9_CORLD|nr:oligoribonuclease [Corynebacterium lipophiloflavum]EEI17202.1 exonuclease [Corynebacterium lipophiloflavum DSM 44291]
MSHEIATKNDRIVWIDLEMTGLDPDKHVIVEVAALVTDADLNILGDGIDIVVHATDAQLAKMDDVVVSMHTDNGLLTEITASTVSLADAEDAVLGLVTKHCDPAHPAPLAGNSIATDRSFIRAHMPRLDAALHYRMIDVSTVKELARRWFPKAYFNQPDKGMSHRALADIVESIRELDYYRRSVFVEAPGPDSQEATEASTAARDAYQRFL